MDRLVVSDPVSQEVDALDSILDVLPYCSRIGGVRVTGELGSDRRHPQTGEVGAAAQVAPESEGQLRDDLAVGLDHVTPRGPLSRLGDVVDRACSVSTGEELTPCVPLRLPSSGRPEPNQSIVDGVAKQDLEPADVLVERTAHGAVPVVES